MSKARTKHGHATREKRTKIYNIWKEMRARCENPSNKEWRNYGGRGVTVCERWRDFENFLKDMGERAPGLSLDRIDNNKGYGPDNCRWATSRTQVRNSRIAKLTNDQVAAIYRAGHGGTRVALLAGRFAVSESTVRSILNGSRWADVTASILESTP